MMFPYHTDVPMYNTYSRQQQQQQQPNYY